MTVLEKKQVRKEKRNTPEYIKEPMFFKGMGLSDAHKRLASHLFFFTYDGTRDFTTSTRDLQEILEWKTKDKVEEALANLTVRRMISRVRTPRGTMLTWNANQDEWIKELKEEHWIDALNNGTIAKGKKAASVRKTRTLECPKNQDTECPKNQDTDQIQCPKNQDTVSEKPGHCLHTLDSKEIKERSKEGKYKEREIEPEVLEVDEYEVQALLRDWEDYIYENAIQLKVNANRVWGNGIEHSEAIAKLLMQGESINDIKIVFEFWKSEKCWFKTCLTPKKLLTENDGQSVFAKLLISAEKILQKNASYQIMKGLKSLKEANKNGTLAEAPF